MTHKTLLTFASIIALSFQAPVVMADNQAKAMEDWIEAQLIAENIFDRN